MQMYNEDLIHLISTGRLDYWNTQNANNARMLLPCDCTRWLANNVVNKSSKKMSCFCHADKIRCRSTFTDKSNQYIDFNVQANDTVQQQWTGRKKLTPINTHEHIHRYTHIIYHVITVNHLSASHAPSPIPIPLAGNAVAKVPHHCTLRNAVNVSVTIMWATVSTACNGLADSAWYLQY